MTEEYFPRGGKKPNVTYFKQSSNFLGAAEKGQGKKKKQKKRSENDDGYLSDEAVQEVDQSYKMCASGIGYKTLKPGVNVLARVWKVLDTKLRVMMPGKAQGSIMACHVSEPYNKLLEAYVNDETEKVRELSEMFSPGQYVAAHMLEEKDSEGVMVSLMPQHVNSARTHSDLLKGDILQAAVSSVEDHGYVMDIGVANTRAFLPKAEANTEFELDVGLLTWTSVKSVTVSADNSIVTLSNAPASLQKAVRRKKGTLLPGSAVEFTVDKPLENGIEGRVLDATAYIQRFHADRASKKPSLGQKIRSYVLYVMPTRNAPFLTTRNIFESARPDLSEEMKLKEGDIIDEAQVLKITGRSIHFKLGKHSVGTMSLKRVAVHEDLSDEQVVAQSYPIGSTHRVRILNYNLSDYIYHVTDEAKLLKEKYFSFSQLRPGELVSGTIRTVADNHVTVTVGRLFGYVPQQHLSDAGVYIDPKKASTSKLTKKKYKVGQAVTARVVSVDEVKQTLTLSLKPSLVAPDAKLLTSYEQAEVGKAYTGVIKVVKDFVLVAFLDNVMVYVPRNQVSRTPVANLTEAFHPGQVVSCTVLSVTPESKRMLGSLTLAPFWPAAKSPEHREKRKNDMDGDEVPNKKRKTSESDDTEAKKSKKDKKRKSKDEEESDAVETETKKKKKKDKKTKDMSEESDAIETDIHEDSDQVLKPEDLALIDLSDCETAKQWKKRVVSLMKSIKCRLHRIERIDKKIINIENKGLNAKNKKFHTAMHQEKLVIEERIKKLMEAMKTAQEKLKEFDEEEYRDPNYKEKQKRKKEEKLKALKLAKEDDDTDDETATDAKKKKKEKLKKKGKEVEQKVNKEVKDSKKRGKEKSKKEVKEVVDKSKEIKVVESLEPALEVPSAKEFWSESADNLARQAAAESSSSSEDEETEQPKKKRKKLTAAEKVAKARAEEERLRELEKRAVESEGQPRSSDQFERALLANPNCSQLWIAYMAFHLQATEIDKARAVGRKALNTISFREELEKLNVWLAMLNVEHRFGTKESQQKTLEEALQMNDTFKVHSKLLDIYCDTSKQQELSSLVDLMLRKYKRDPSNYIQCGAACFKLGLVDKARHVMQKAVSVLEKKEHVTVLVQFALLERSHGSRERAEALFEQVLAVYPQRVDVCATYADMLAKDRDIQAVRQVMERMTSQKLPARKMKTLFNKWAELEERVGDAAKAEEVRERAVKFMESAKF